MKVPVIALCTIALAGCDNLRNAQMRNVMAADNESLETRDNITVEDLAEFQSRMHYNQKTLPTGFAVRLDCAIRTENDKAEERKIFLIEKTFADAPDGQTLYDISSDADGSTDFSDIGDVSAMRNEPWPHFSATGSKAGLIVFESDPSEKDMVRYRGQWSPATIDTVVHETGRCKLYQDERALVKASGN